MIRHAHGRNGVAALRVEVFDAGLRPAIADAASVLKKTEGLDRFQNELSMRFLHTQRE